MTLLSVAEIDRWNPGAIRQVFHSAEASARASLNTAEVIGSLPAFTTWGGDAAEAARESLGRTQRELEMHGNEALTVARAADNAAGGIEKVKADLAGLRADAGTMNLAIDTASSRVVPGPGADLDDPLDLQAEIDGLQSRLDAILADAELVDDDLARAIDMADGDLPVSDDRSAIREELTRPLPEDPEEFNEFWDQLTDGEKDYLYQRDSDIGNHPGMPFVDRDHYNQLHLDELQQTTQANVDRLQNRLDELVSQQYMGDHSTATGQQLAALAPQLRDARHRLDGYIAVQAALNPAGSPARPDQLEGVPRLLGHIDDQGHAAVSIGNPDTASRNALFVPGTGQNMAAFEGSDAKSQAMFRAALSADPDLGAQDIAVTTWMGYDRPMDLGEAAFPGRAETGGGTLDRFLDGMHASHSGPPAVDTVIGHSYGSTVVGGAASFGNDLAADNVIAVGSPGMMVEDVGGLHLPDGANVYAMTARNDIISFATDMTLGADPYTKDFGATRLWTDPGPTWGPGNVFPSVPAHSSYWDPGNPGLANMGSIIAGLPPNQIVTPDGRVTVP